MAASYLRPDPGDCNPIPSFLQQVMPLDPAAVRVLARPDLAGVELFVIEGHLCRLALILGPMPALELADRLCGAAQAVLGDDE